MKIDKYISGRKYGLGIEFILNVARKRCSHKDDDFFLFTIGHRSTGKSRLMLHLMEAYMGDRANIDYIGLRKGDFANALYKAAQIDMPRMCVNDEGNLSSKEGMTKFNRAVVDTYFSIRGMNMFHNWCNPSLQGIEKQFIKEIVNGVIFTYTKYKNVRLYYYFTKKAILELYKKEKNLELTTLKKHARKYAHHRGYFFDYDGFLLEDYKKKKDKRMLEKIGDFYNDWGSTEELLNHTQLSRALGISMGSLYNAKKKLEKKGLLGSDIKQNASGINKYPRKYIEIFANEFKKKENKK